MREIDRATRDRGRVDVDPEAMLFDGAADARGRSTEVMQRLDQVPIERGIARSLNARVAVRLFAAALTVVLSYQLLRAAPEPSTAVPQKAVPSAEPQVQS